MASVNKVIIVGNLGADPEIKTFDNGGKIANISVATTDRWTDRNTGEQREATEWHRITFNDRLADIVAQYLRKGSQVYVEGSLRTRKWQDPQTGQDRYTTEIRGISMQMLGSRPQNSYDNGGYQNQGYNNQGFQNQGFQGQANFANQNGYHNAPQNGYNNAPPQGQWQNNAPNTQFNAAPQQPAMTPNQGHTPSHNNQFGSPTQAPPAQTPKIDTPAMGGAIDDDMPF